MTRTNIATEWHYRPNRRGPCAVCGCWLKHGKHRAAKPGDRPAWVKWFRTINRGLGYEPVGEKPPLQNGGTKPGTVRRPAIAEKATAERVGQAVALLANGKSMAETGRRLGVYPSTIAYWRRTWPDLWEKTMREALGRAADALRAVAGTEAVLTDQTQMQASGRILRQCRKNDVVAFESNGKTTLTTFYRKWYLPQKLFEATEGTKGTYEVALRQWQLATGDPPLREIKDETVALFRDYLLRQSGRKQNSTKSVNTVRTEMQMIQTLLDKCGPPGPKNRDGRGLLKVVPWAQRPRKELRIPKTVSLDSLGKCYAAANEMELPSVAGIQTGDWWRALLVVAYNTGLRHASLFALRWEHVEWENCRATIPASCMKSRRPQVIHFNRVTLKHLQRIRRVSGPVFPFPQARRRFWQLLHLLQKRAGIPEAEWFGLHGLRRTLATLLWEESPGAAQFALGHTTSDVTRQHYVDGGAMVARALDQLPQPEAFSA
jgi:integrase